MPQLSTYGVSQDMGHLQSHEHARYFSFKNAINFSVYSSGKGTPAMTSLRPGKVPAPNTRRSPDAVI